tara:strand:- start:15277 stop:15612 length:336 start_codon:yes stop_codon:yes gene_type:complete
MAPIQLLGLLIGLLALHITFIYYKKSELEKGDLFIWSFIWLVFVFISLNPNILKSVTQHLNLSRPMDAIMIGAFMVLLSVSFYNYVVNKKNKKNIEKLIKELALRDLDQYK